MAHGRATVPTITREETYVTSTLAGLTHSPEDMRRSFDFELSTEELAAIGTLDRGPRVAWGRIRRPTRADR